MSFWLDSCSRWVPCSPWHNQMSIWLESCYSSHLYPRRHLCPCQSNVPHRVDSHHGWVQSPSHYNKVPHELETHSSGKWGDLLSHYHVSNWLDQSW